MSTGRLRSPALRPHDVKAAETALYPPDRISSGRRRQGVGQLVHVDVLPGMMAEDFLCAGLELRLGRAHPEQQTAARSEEHTSELQSLMRISYAVFCLKKKNTTIS